jgi:hypothetical protein
MKKPFLYSALAASVAFFAWAFYPVDEPVRSNVIDSTKGGAKSNVSAETKSVSEDQTTSGNNTTDKNGNVIGLPVRMINAPSFDQILAAAAMINGAVDQKETASFIEITTSKRITSLNVELANLEAELSKAKLTKAEYDKKLGTTENVDNESDHASEFIMADEAPENTGEQNQSSPIILANTPNKTVSSADSDNPSMDASSEATTVKSSKSMKLKGIAGDGRFSLQLGKDFASNVRLNQVVFSRYRIESFDNTTGCMSYTDLKIKNSRGFTCYN